MSNMPDWATLPKHIKAEMDGIVTSIKEELITISCLSSAHPQSLSRMERVNRLSHAFIIIANRIAGANNPDLYAYQQGKEQSNG